MKKVLKKVGIGVVVTLILSLCFVFIGVAYLFLYPKGELFGIVYASEKSSKVYTIGEYDITTLKEIKVTSTRFNIIIQADEVDTVRAYVKSKVSGFAKKDKSTTNLACNYNKSNKSVALNLSEPSGLVSANDSYIKVFIPKALMENGLKLDLNTGKKTDIKIYGEKYTKLSELKVNINRGDLYFDGLEAENIIIKANKSNIYTGDNVTGVTKYMSLDIGKSKVNFLYAGNGAEYLTKEIPEKDKINYKVENLCIKNAEKNSLIRLFNCDYLYSDTGCVVSAGEIRLYYLGKSNFKSSDTILSIYKMTNEDNDSNMSFDGKGGVTITENYSPLNIIGNSGTISIKMSDAVMSLEVNTGSINVENARKKLALIVNRGKAYINYAKDAEDSSYTVDREVVSLRTKHGNIFINGVEKIDAVVDDGGAPTIKIFYHKVVGKSNLDVGNANLQVVVPVNEAVTLDVVGTNAYLQSDVGTATRENSILNSSYLRHAYGNASGNILKINTSGEVVLMSSDIYELKK